MLNDVLTTAVALGVKPPFAFETGAGHWLDRSLHAIRTHLDMDVAFISEFRDGRRFFRHVDSRSPNGPVEVGGSDPLEESYCLRVADGRLPELMTDACMNAEALTLAATRALPVGAHLSVPIRLADGRVYGTFCCFRQSPDGSLTHRDLGMLRVVAQMVGDQIQQELSASDARQEIENRVHAVLNSDGLRMVYQPIFDLVQERITGFEALARFSTDPYRTPDVWFAEAAQAGLSIELEMKAIRMALQGLDRLPVQSYVSVNTSPDTLVNGNFSAELCDFPLDRIVVEITEHQAVERYEDISEVIRPLQAQGLRIAIDDAGAGYASFRHILNLHPHIVKLDTSITRSIDTDRSRRALAAALRGFATETGCKIVAEGVETAAELQTIRALGIGKAQGYYLGRPMPLEQARLL
ncbi:EAL domain-containing protein [Acidovorax facilis]|uniref:sensor domain-containing phosphodiesterase n=1 Tax=Acidovorax facilis TaxID=12917 RepID=UPI003CED0AD5